MESGSASSRITLTPSLNPVSIILVASLVFSTGCASTPKPTVEPPPTAPTVKSEDLSPNEQIQKLRDKIVDLETRLSALNEKINLEQSGLPTKKGATDPSVEIARETKNGIELETEMVQPAPAASKVVPTTRAFVKNEIVDRYREAKILFDSTRYTDATVEFATFVKEYPDHALAPAAQYHVGLGYLKQSEIGRAEEELNRGLLSYPHSSYVPDTLLALMNIAQQQNKSGRVTYFQQKILGTFPNSPQAVQAALKSNTHSPDSTLGEPKLIGLPQAPDKPQTPEPPGELH
jgi:TolA-binding protein